MTDWYRKTTWTKEDEEYFFAKLARARKDGRAQYLKLQAATLIGTKDLALMGIAEMLLLKLLSDYPDNRIEKSISLKLLGDIYMFRGNFQKSDDIL